MQYELLAGQNLVKVSFVRPVTRDPDFEKKLCGRTELLAYNEERDESVWVGVICSVHEWETYLQDSILQANNEPYNRDVQLAALELKRELSYFRGLVAQWVQFPFYRPWRDQNNILL